MCKGILRLQFRVAHLGQVDLIACEGVDASLSIKPLITTCRRLTFRNVFLFAPDLPYQVQALVTVWVRVRWTYEEWNRFMVKELNNYLDDGYALNIHSDGYVLNPKAWTDEFLNYDYIGAPWWYNDGINVGNGGFSLRSKKYLSETAKFNLDRYAPEDHLMIRERGAILAERGVRFAPEALASRFSREGNGKFGRKWNGEFGFHGTGVTDTSNWKG